TIFFPTDRSECVSKFECEVKLPITALASGDLRNVGRNEVVTISAHGLLQCLEFPQGDPPGPSRIFCQQLNSNVCSAKILDIDNDGKMEMIVIMTDRVAERVIVVDSECNNEVELRNIGADVSCISSALLSPGLYVVVTIDPFGTLSVYGWTDPYKRAALGTLSNPSRCC
uniref:Uncharacterized protein n=1 Tax=Acrobeloides nanus TaxID=290746 RepID=A0A914CX03_9BILA